MENNFVEVAKRTIDELHEMNMDTIEDMGGTYSELFPLYAGREVIIDGEKYIMTMDITIRKPKM